MTIKQFYLHNIIFFF